MRSSPQSEGVRDSHFTRGGNRIEISRTLTQAIAVAGGFQDTAKHSQVLLVRRVNREWVPAKT
ncbi:MAG: hypothetical protein WB683_18745 [Candidatus Sulfotelmatobacter sp.]